MSFATVLGKLPGVAMQNRMYRKLCMSVAGVLATAPLFAGPTIGRQVPQVSPIHPAKAFRWPDGKRAAVSVSFDDARVSQIDFYNLLALCCLTYSAISATVPSQIPWAGSFKYSQRASSAAVSVT